MWWRRRKEQATEVTAAVSGPAPTVVTGRSPQGDEVSLHIGSGSWRLYFLTSTCAACAGVWDGLAPDPTVSTAVVTPDAATESRSKVTVMAARLPDIPVVMSTPAWLAFAAGPAPWMVDLVEGRVIAAGRCPDPTGSKRGRPAARRSSR